MENLAKIKQRVIFFVENQGIKKEDFYKKISSNGGNFRGKSLKSELSGDKIAEILLNFPDINPEWLLTGNGDMLKGSEIINNVSEINVQYGKNIDYKEKYCEVLEKYYQLSEENKHLRSLIEKNKKLNSQHAQDATV